MTPTTRSATPSPISESDCDGSSRVDERSKTCTSGRARDNRPGRTPLRPRLPGLRRPARASGAGDPDARRVHGPSRARPWARRRATRCCLRSRLRSRSSRPRLGRGRGARKRRRRRGPRQLRRLHVHHRRVRLRSSPRWSPPRRCARTGAAGCSASTSPGRSTALAIWSRKGAGVLARHAPDHPRPAALHAARLRPRRPWAVRHRDSRAPGAHLRGRDHDRASLRSSVDGGLELHHPTSSCRGRSRAAPVRPGERRAVGDRERELRRTSSTCSARRSSRSSSRIGSSARRPTTPIRWRAFDLARGRRSWRGHPGRRARLLAPLSPPRGVPVSEPRVVAENVSKWFGALVAVSDVSFDVGPGVTALLGPNGAGKSTMFRMLCGLARPSKGTVRVLGRDPRADTGVTRLIGLVPQQESVFEPLTAREFVTLSARLQGLPDPAGAAAAALETVDLDPSDSRRLPAYSKGMRQRVKVAQAIVHDPAVLVLDEPLTGLDPRQRMDMVALFRRLGSEGRCVIVSSHVLDEVERLGSQVLVMSQGRLAAAGDFHESARADGRPADADSSPHRPATRARPARCSKPGLRSACGSTETMCSSSTRRTPGRWPTHSRRSRATAAPASTRCIRSTPTSRASSATWCSDERGREAVSARPGTLVSLLALYRLLLRTQITVPRLLGIGALGAPLDRDRGVCPPGRQLASGGCGRRLRLRARDPRSARDALARHFGDRRPRGGQAARLPVAEARAALAASRGRRARHGQRRRAADRAAAHRVRRRRGRRRRGLGDAARRDARRARVRRPVRRGGPLVSARGLVGACLRSDLGERRGLLAEGAARFTVFGWASSVLGLAPEIDVEFEAGSAAVAFVVLPAIAVAAWLAATWRYRRADID